MDQITADFTGVRATALLELYLRSLDAAERRPILGDALAGPAVKRIDFDFSQFRSMDVGRFAVGVRSGVMDRWVGEFLAANPGATVIDLGSGLDSRVSRVHPAPGHSWFDVDFPDVIDVARRLYPARDEHTSIGASVVDSGWLEQVPSERPVIAVADGLLGFLDEHEVRATITNILDHFPSGEIVFNITSSVVRAQRDKHPVPIFTRFGIEEKWWLDSPDALEKMDSRLRYVGRNSLMDKRLLTHAPLYYRLMGALVRAVPAWNNSGWILRYSF